MEITELIYLIDYLLYILTMALSLGKDHEFVGDIKLSMWIPQELGGKVVGKQGILISNIKIETGCSLVNAMKPLDSSLWSAIVIIGIKSK